MRVCVRTAAFLAHVLLFNCMTTLSAVVAIVVSLARNQCCGSAFVVTETFGDVDVIQHVSHVRPCHTFSP